MGMKEAVVVEIMDMAMMVGEGKEVMVQLRLFYLGVVHSLKNMVHRGYSLEDKDGIG